MYSAVGIYVPCEMTTVCEFLIHLFELISKVFAPCLLVAKTSSRIIIWLLFLLLLVCALEEHIFYFYFPASVCVLFDKGDLAAFRSCREGTRRWSG